MFLRSASQSPFYFFVQPLATSSPAHFLSLGRRPSQKTSKSKAFLAILSFTCNGCFQKRDLKWGWGWKTFKGYSLVLHYASLLRTIFASSARAHERVHVQNVRDFPQTKLDNGINSPFPLNEHGDPRFFFQVFSKNSLMKDIFEEEKKFDSRTWFFGGKWFPTGCILAKARTSTRQSRTA